MSQTTQAFKQKLSQRKQEIEKELAQVEEAIKAFEPGQPTPTSKPTRRRKRQRIDVSKVLGAVNDNPGLKASEVARKVGITRSSSYRALNQLKADDEVVKYGTRWYTTRKIEQGIGGSSGHL